MTARRRASRVVRRRGIVAATFMLHQQDESGYQRRHRREYRGAPHPLRERRIELHEPDDLRTIRPAQEPQPLLDRERKERALGRELPEERREYRGERLQGTAQPDECDAGERSDEQEDEAAHAISATGAANDRSRARVARGLPLVARAAQLGRPSTSPPSSAPVPDKPPFRDLFSSQASAYAAYRPRYPAALFAWLAGVVTSRRVAWDCATGSGQAATGLAAHFARVIATDASAAQLAHAAPAPNVDYRVAAAEHGGLASASVDLVNVAQALHWFDLERFYVEATRVLVPGGVLAVSSYGSATLDDPALSAIFSHFEHETLGAWWPDGRRHVGEGLREAAFPFVELVPPPLTLECRWTLDALLGYARSWSATARFVAHHDRDPVVDLGAALSPVWGDPLRSRRVRWPFVVRAGRAH